MLFLVNSFILIVSDRTSLTSVFVHVQTKLLFAFLDANLSIESIKCLGISTQRATFLTWSRDTGEPFHNFITWKDIRAKKLCKDLNASPTVKVFSNLPFFIYFF